MFSKRILYENGRQFKSNLKKFDGKKTRNLNLSEISQIAGRAGRHINAVSYTHLTLPTKA